LYHEHLNLEDETREEDRVKFFNDCECTYIYTLTIHEVYWKAIEKAYIGIYSSAI